MSRIFVEEIHTVLDSFDIYKLFHNEKYSFFLDSGMDHERLGRYSFIGLNPFLVFEAKNNNYTVSQYDSKKEYSGNPFIKLQELLKEYKIENKTKIPFVGGAVGFFSYDLRHHIEKLPKDAEDDLNIEDIIVGFYDHLVVIDHLESKKYIVGISFSEKDEEKVFSRLMEMKGYIEDSKIQTTDELDAEFVDNKVNLVSNFTKEKYCETIEKAREYIRCGDIYQMNMTQRFTTLINKHPINIYSQLRNINPAPFSSYLNYGELKVVSSSPERFIEIRNGGIETRPIKGTMPRGRDEKEDKENWNILNNSIKDKAENLMIVDLLRNDIGKVCKFGSVKVPELFYIDSYATVHHLISTVTGELKENHDVVDCLVATFPGGSITGAPKIRAMEIIDELEPTCRSIYTGSIGYIGFDGNADLNIVIRTIIIKNDRAYYQVGGGIVWDSVPEKEYEETMDKGAALMKVLLDKALKY